MTFQCRRLTMWLHGWVSARNSLLLDAHAATAHALSRFDSKGLDWSCYAGLHDGGASWLARLIESGLRLS
jgi:hypothetical protein